MGLDPDPRESIFLFLIHLSCYLSVYTHLGTALNAFFSFILYIYTTHTLLIYTSLPPSGFLHISAFVLDSYICFLYIILTLIRADGLKSIASRIV